MSTSLDPLRFAAIAEGLEVDDARRAQRMARTVAAGRRYVILFSARSGSSWLTSILSATERLGFPQEYINPNMVRGTAQAMDARTANDLLEMLLRARQSRNGIFGMKVRSVDIDLLGEPVFLAKFAEKAIFFHLWRDNLVAQAVSLYRAVTTRRFHSNTVDEVQETPAYDADQIQHWLRHVAATENDNAALLAKHGLAARHLRYEQITAARLATVRQFAHVLGVPFTPEDFSAQGERELSKIGDGWNDEAEARFRRERGDDILAIEAARLIKRGVSGPRPHQPPVDLALAQMWQDGSVKGRLGRSPLTNPFNSAEPEHGVWHRGWCDGWNDQIYLAKRS